MMMIPDLLKSSKIQLSLSMTYTKKLQYAYIGCFFKHIKCSSTKAVFHLRRILSEVILTKQGDSYPFANLSKHQIQQHSTRLYK